MAWTPTTYDLLRAFGLHDPTPPATVSAFAPPSSDPQERLRQIAALRAHGDAQGMIGGARAIAKVPGRDRWQTDKMDALTVGDAATAERLAASPMIGKGVPTMTIPRPREAVPAPAVVRSRGEDILIERKAPEIRQSELPEPATTGRAPVPPPLQAEVVRAEPGPVARALASDEAAPDVEPEPKGKGYWSGVGDRLSHGLSGIAAAFARNPNPTLGQIGAAMAGGVAQGKQQDLENAQAEEMMGWRRQRAAMEGQELDLRRQQLEAERGQEAKRQELIAQLPPETQKLYSLFGDKALESLMPAAPKVMEVGNQVVAVGPDGKANVLYSAPQEGLTPYQQAQLDMDRQRLGLEQRRLEMSGREGVKPMVVGGNLVDPSTGKVIFSDPGRETGKPVVVDGNLVDPATGKVIFSAPPKPGDTPKPVVVGNALVDPTTGKTIYQAPASERDEPLVPVMKDGKPILLPRSQAAGLPPADTREAGAGFNQAKDLRNSFEKLTADPREAVNAFNKIRSGFEQETGAGDIAGVFGYMKMLDPTSVVREGEYATAANAAGVPEYIRGLYNRVAEGEKLTPQQRQEMIAAAAGQLGAYRQRYEETAKNYGELADRAGVPRENVVLPLTFPEYRPPNTVVTVAPSAGSAVAAEAPKGGAPAGSGTQIDLDKLLDEELMGVD